MESFIEKFIRKLKNLSRREFIAETSALAGALYPIMVSLGMINSAMAHPFLLEKLKNRSLINGILVPQK